MTKVAWRASRVTARIQRAGFTFGPEVYIAIASLIVQLVRWWMECRQYHPTAHAGFQKAGPWAHARARRMARRILSQSNIPDNGLSTEIVEHTFAEFQGMTDTQVDLVVQEVRP